MVYGHNQFDYIYRSHDCLYLEAPLRYMVYLWFYDDFIYVGIYRDRKKQGIKKGPALHGARMREKT